MRNVEIHINGLVQGVGFRYHTREVAREFNIKGFVRNTADGSVFIHAEGTKDSIKKFITWCYDGPRIAVVESVNVFESNDEKYADFIIK